MVINWKDEVLKYCPDAWCDGEADKYTGYLFVIKCDTHGAKGHTQEQAWKRTYFNIVKSAPVKDKFTKGDIVDHDDYLRHLNTFSMLRMNGNPEGIDKEYLTELDRKIKAYEKLQPVNNANSSKGNYSISDTMFLPLSNGANEVIKGLTHPNLTASKIQEIEQQITWLWVSLTVVSLVFTLAIIALF